MNDPGYTCIKKLAHGGVFKWVVVDRYSNPVESEESHFDYEPARDRAEELTAQAIADRISAQAAR